MRRYIPCWESIGIKKDRYLELLHFCRQYPEWKSEAASLIGIRGKALDGMPHGAGVGDPVASAAERREKLMKKVDMVELCAMQVEEGAWFAALIQNVCMGRGYDVLDPTLMPTSKRQAFFHARKEFFSLLDVMKQKSEEEL